MSDLVRSTGKSAVKRFRKSLGFVGERSFTSIHIDLDDLEAEMLEKFDGWRRAESPIVLDVRLRRACSRDCDGDHSVYLTVLYDVTETIPTARPVGSD